MNVETPYATPAVKGAAKHLVHHWVQYGALGMIAATFMAVCLYLVHEFVPVLKDGLVTRFRTDETAKLNQTATMQQMANALEAMTVELRNGEKACRDVVALTCTRKAR